MSVEAGTGGVPPFAAKITASFEWNNQWSTSSTTTNTHAYTVNIAPGQVCGPMSLQFSASCQSSIQLNTFMYNNENGLQWDVCDILAGAKTNELYGLLLVKIDLYYGNDAVNQFQQICASTIPMSPQGQMYLDVTPGSGLDPYVIMGCALTP